MVNNPVETRRKLILREADEGKIHTALFIFGTLFLFFYFILGQASKLIEVDSDNVINYYLMLGTLLAVYSFQWASFRRYKTLSFYTSAYLIANLVVLSILSYGSILFLFPAMVLFMLLFDNLVSFRAFPRRNLRFGAFILILIFMAFLGNLFTFVNQAAGLPITFESQSDVMIALGTTVPLLEFHGMVILSPHVDLIISPMEYFIFMLLAMLVSENYYEIISYVVSRHSTAKGISATAYGVVGALSCQCESAIALLPAVAIFVIDLLLLPLIFLSILLLLGTYILVTRFYKNNRKPLFGGNIFGKRAKTLIFLGIASLLIGTPVLVTVGVYYSMQNNPLFFFGVAMITIFTGYIMMIYIGKFLKINGSGLILPVSLMLIASVISIVWYIPDFTEMALESASIYGFMNLTGILSGILFGLSYSLFKREGKNSLTEYIMILFGVIPLFVFYYSMKIDRAIYPFWNVYTQLEFSLILWFVMLPLMWIATHISLNDLVVQDSASIGNNVINDGSLFD
jgi:hypothetical protein